MFLWVLKLYQMDVAHAILFARKLDISRLTAHYLSAKFEFLIENVLTSTVLDVVIGAPDGA